MFVLLTESGAGVIAHRSEPTVTTSGSPAAYSPFRPTDRPDHSERLIASFWQPLERWSVCFYERISQDSDDGIPNTDVLVL